MLATEDGKYDHSQLHMYVANSPNDVLHGEGQLFAFVGDGQNITSFRDLKWTTISWPIWTINLGLEDTGFFQA